MAPKEITEYFDQDGLRGSFTGFQIEKAYAEMQEKFEAYRKENPIIDLLGDIKGCDVLAHLTILPSDPSEAGPGPVDEPPKDWKDWSWEASENLQESRVIYDDSPREQRRKRLKLMEAAIAAIERAKEVLP